jgi:2-desacetyl-2-hydroxyethyl bacteriochlorophyllide A dehydrogenase
VKAAVFHGPRDVRTEEVPDPVPGDGDVLIRVRACGICGSDLHTYKHGLFPELGIPVDSGRILGHEFSGDVVEVNGEVPGVSAGDRVTTIFMGGAAEFLRIPALVTPAICRLPDNVSYEEAATVEPLANSVHAVALANLNGGETSVVLGVGIIGLGVIQVLKTNEAGKIVAVDLSDRRLAMAKELGADVIINAAREDAYDRVLEATGSTPLGFSTPAEPAGNVDAVFDCAGAGIDQNGSSLQEGLRMVKEGGKVIVVAVPERPVELQSGLLVRKGASIIGSWAWTLDEFREALDLIATGRVDRRRLITHEFPLQRAREAYETALSADESIKVLIKP